MSATDTAPAGDSDLDRDLDGGRERDVDRGLDRDRLVRRVVLGLTMAAFVVGAALVTQVGSDTSARVEAAESLVRAFYETGDVQRVVDRVVPGSLGQEVSDQQLIQALQPLLSGPAEIGDAELVTVRGVDIVRVPTPQLEWCVTPDGGLLLGCRVANVPIEASVQDAPLDIAFSGIDVFATRVSLAVVLTTSEAQPVPLDGTLALEQPDGANLELVDTSYVAGGQQVPVSADELAVQPQTGLLLVYEDTEAADLDVVIAGPFTLRWEGGSVQLETGEVTWFVE